MFSSNNLYSRAVKGGWSRRQPPETASPTARRQAQAQLESQVLESRESLEKLVQSYASSRASRRVCSSGMNAESATTCEMPVLIDASYVLRPTLPLLCKQWNAASWFAGNPNPCSTAEEGSLHKNCNGLFKCFPPKTLSPIEIRPGVGPGVPTSAPEIPVRGFAYTQKGGVAKYPESVLAQCSGPGLAIRPTAGSEPYAVRIGLRALRRRRRFAAVQ